MAIQAILSALRDALMITGFVATMMLLIEYLNVLTAGAWQWRLARRGWRQYVLAAGLGAIPGCLGAFSAVAMYSHGLLSLGAVAAAMVAASGDEAFVMLALIPRQTFFLIPCLAVLGVATGVVVDLLAGKRAPSVPIACKGLELHFAEQPECFPPARVAAQWRELTPTRGTLAVSLIFFSVGVLSGRIGPGEWNWIRVSLLVVAGLALFVVATVSDHFLESHLWNHVVRKHVPRIFAWTFAALLLVGPLSALLRPEHAAGHGKWFLLAAACLVGLIPESGPHLIFVTMYAQGAVPFGVLLANSVVQDGHGMLPLLAHSRREFVKIKAVNFAAGMLAGAASLALAT